MSVGDLFVYSKNKNIKHDSVHTNNNVSSTSMILKINKKLAQIQLTEIMTFMNKIHKKWEY